MRAKPKFVRGPKYILLMLSSFLCCALGSCCGAVQVDGQFVKMCKRLVLQFVILRPILAVITIALSARGYYKEGTWTTDSGCASF